MEKLQPYQEEAARGILDNRQAMEALLKGETITLHNPKSHHSGHNFTGKYVDGNIEGPNGEHACLTMDTGDKWRIIPPPVEELSFEDACKVPGRYESKDGATLKVDSTCYEFFDIASMRKSRVYFARVTTDKYTRIGD